jgi:hypothetical protein
MVFLGCSSWIGPARWFEFGALPVEQENKTRLDPMSPIRYTGSPIGASPKPAAAADDDKERHEDI